MKLTKFGKEVRKARVETGDTLTTMSKALNKSSAFLSAIETGKTKIPLDMINSVIMFFGKKDFEFGNDLRVLATIDNGVVPLDNLSEKHKTIIAIIANTNYTEKQLDVIYDILREK